MTLEEDRAEVERVILRWQGVSESEQQAMLAKLGKMLDYLGFEDVEFMLRLDIERLIMEIEARLGQAPKAI